MLHDIFVNSILPKSGVRYVYLVALASSYVICNQLKIKISTICQILKEFGYRSRSDTDLSLKWAILSHLFNLKILDLPDQSWDFACHFFANCFP